jgi:hypothetical protein
MENRFLVSRLGVTVFIIGVTNILRLLASFPFLQAFIP